MVVKKKIIKASRVVAANEDEMFLDDDAIDMLDEKGTDSSDDTLDEIADKIDDIKDTVENVEQDDEYIEVTNNIEDHYIAECDNCGGIFISAIKETEDPVEYVHGTCPLCQEETDQYLKWTIQKV